jgi:hypothetical protein
MSFFSKIENRKVKTDSVWGLAPVQRGGEDIRKEDRRMNVVEILCTPV